MPEQVFVFETTADKQIKVRWEASGPQLGAYFGAAVATGDVNGDGWSELFVGAPLYNSIGEIRRDCFSNMYLPIHNTATYTSLRLITQRYPIEIKSISMIDQESWI